MRKRTDRQKEGQTYGRTDGRKGRQTLVYRSLSAKAGGLKRHLNEGEIQISDNKCEKLLGIKIGSKLIFDCYVKSLCKKASQKLNALSRVAYQLDFNQRKLL